MQLFSDGTPWFGREEREASIDWYRFAPTCAPTGPRAVGFERASKRSVWPLRNCLPNIHTAALPSAVTRRSNVRSVSHISRFSQRAKPSRWNESLARPRIGSPPPSRFSQCSIRIWVPTSRRAPTSSRSSRYERKTLTPCIRSRLSATSECWKLRRAIWKLHKAGTRKRSSVPGGIRINPRSGTSWEISR